MIRIFTKHRFLLLQITKRQIEQRHRGSLLGILWGGIQPLMMMSIYTVVFGLIFKGHYDGYDNKSTSSYALGVFLSLTIFHVIADVIQNSTVAIVSQPNLVKKIVFPLEILPISGMLHSLFQFSISMFLLLVGVFVIGDGFALNSLYFFVVILPLIPMCIGLAFLFSSLGVFVRDLQQVMGPTSMIILYSSAVFYSKDMVPAGIWVFLKYNPLVHVVQEARATLLWHQSMNWGGILYSWVFGLVFMLFGLMCFKKLRNAFADAL